MSEIEGKIEAIIFSSGEPVELKVIADAIELSEKMTEDLLDCMIKKKKEEKSGVLIIKVKGKYQMCSNQEYFDVVKKTRQSINDRPLSSAAMEVLACVAYNGPCTKAFVEKIRGVDCSYIFHSLIDRKLIEEKGRLELPGKPLTYDVTDTFFRCAKINDKTELPKMVEVVEE